MGDGLKLTKEMRHRSSSSLAGAALESTRSERKLDIDDFIPEVNNQFTVAEARCKDLEEKLDIIKSLKRKKIIKKRSMTKIAEQPVTSDNVPFITVRTQPKKKISQQAARMRRLEVPPNPTRGYLDPATVEQHRMIRQVRGYNNSFKQPHQERSIVCKTPEHKYSKPKNMRQQRSQADGDSGCGNMQLLNNTLNEVGCGQDSTCTDYSNNVNFDDYERHIEVKPESNQKKQTSVRQRHVTRDVPAKEDNRDSWRNTGSSRRRGASKQTSAGTTNASPWPYRENTEKTESPNPFESEERPVVELFNKSYASPDYQQEMETMPTLQPNTKSKKGHNFNNTADDLSSNRLTKGYLQPSKRESHIPRRTKYRSRRYELPTVASQMKQAGMRYYYETGNHTNIPFVVSKSTAPSHNIGVNIQQVLNGLKIQQPLSGIPLTIAHHMGLGHVPITYRTKKAATVPALDNRVINSIKVGQRLLRLPSYKYMSYNRLLSLYREGDGMVPRFLRAISRPHYFYTSMYNLATNNEDFDCGMSSKARAPSQMAKRNLTEFANLYREYKKIDKCLKEGKCDPALLQRKEDLSRELVAREQQICRVVQDYRSSHDQDQTLRASASAAEDYRHSSFKLDAQQ